MQFATKPPKKTKEEAGDVEKVIKKRVRKTKAASSKSEEPIVSADSESAENILEQLNTKGGVKVEPMPEKPLHNLYTLKFNSPILPFAKFPLT